MTDKSLSSKAIEIKGKDYVMVKDRVTFFNENYKNGKIVTDVVSDTGKEIVFKAVIIPDVANPERVFCGHAAGIRGGRGVDATSAVENAETSAVGRALAMMGIGVIDSVASGDEIKIAEKREYTEVEDNMATFEQKKLIAKLLTDAGVNKIAMKAKIKGLGFDPNNITKEDASGLIDKLKGLGSEEEKAVDEIFDSLDD